MRCYSVCAGKTWCVVRQTCEYVNMGSNNVKSRRGGFLIWGLVYHSLEGRQTTTIVVATDVYISYCLYWLWCCCDDVVVLLWCCCCDVVVLLCCCCGSVMVLLWGCWYIWMPPPVFPTTAENFRRHTTLDHCNVPNTADKFCWPLWIYEHTNIWLFVCEFMLSPEGEDS